MNYQLGGVNHVFRGPMYQQGYGLGGYFRKFMKWLIPITEKHVLPHLKSGLSYVGNEAIDAVNKIAKDTIQGRNIKESTNEHMNSSIENIKRKAEQKLAGEGINKKKKLKNKIIYKKHKDIFS
jgi:hypothetical protein